MPQAIIMMVSTMNGDHALMISAVEYNLPPSVCLAAVIACAGSSANRQVFFGFQYFKKITRQMIEPMPAMTSGNDGPTKLDEKNCNKANEPPETNIGGNTSIAFLKPAIKT